MARVRASWPCAQAQEFSPDAGHQGDLQGHLSGSARSDTCLLTFPVPCPERPQSRVSQPREAGRSLIAYSLGPMVQGRPRPCGARWPRGRQPPVLQHLGQLLLLPWAASGGASLCRLFWYLGLSPGPAGPPLESGAGAAPRWAEGGRGKSPGHTGWWAPGGVRPRAREEMGAGKGLLQPVVPTEDGD